MSYTASLCHIEDNLAYTCTSTIHRSNYICIQHLTRKYLRLGWYWYRWV